MSFASHNSKIAVRFATVVSIGLAAIGCSGRPKNVARSVTGKVTLAGQPLAGATLIFSPVEGGSPSSSTTDDAGGYKLFWARGIEGAQIGEHTVKISTYVDAMPSSKPPRAGVPEKVPYKYRTDAAPTATVKAGPNVIDFALEAGPVEAPVAKGKGKKG